MPSALAAAMEGTAATEETAAHTSCAPTPSCCDADSSNEEGRLVELIVIDRALPEQATPASTTSSVNNSLAHAAASASELGDVPVQPPTNATNAEEETHHQKARFLLIAWAVASVVGMGTAVFAALAGDKVGLFLPRGIFETTAYAMADTVVTINNLLEVAGGQPPAANLQMVVVKRSVCWLVIGLLMDTAMTLLRIFREKKHVDGDWRPVPTCQPFPVLLNLFLCFVCYTGLVGGVMMRAHRDRRPSIMIWFSMTNASFALSTIGATSPYPLIAALGTVLALLAPTAGIYFVIMHVDRNAAQRDVKNGYALLVGMVIWGIQYFTLYLASLSLSVYVVSGVLMTFQKVVLKVLVPVLKRGPGDDDRKLRFFFCVCQRPCSPWSSGLACVSLARTWPRSSSGCFWYFKKPTQSLRIRVSIMRFTWSCVRRSAAWSQ